MKTYAMILAAGVVCAGLAGCNGEPGGNEAGGTVLGAVAGGVIGNSVGHGRGRVATTAVGALLGGLVGNSIGRDLDDLDRRRAQQAEYEALEYGRPVEWRNRESGHYGSIRPGEYYEYEGRRCRSYAHSVYIDGRPEVVRGRACRNRDGTWHSIG